MNRLSPPIPSPTSTYCSDFEFKGLVGSQVLRRSQRLIDKENQELAKTSTPKCRSPQLFGESEDYSQLLCQQEKPSSKVVHLKKTDKVVLSKSVGEIGHASASDKLAPLKASEYSDKVIHLKPSNQALRRKSLGNIETSARILHLKQLGEVQENAAEKNVEHSKHSTKILYLKKAEDDKKTSKELPIAVPLKNLKRKMTYEQSSQPAAKTRAKTPLNRHEAVKTPVSKKYLSVSPTSSQSKLPPTYPEHFDKQIKDIGFVHSQVKSAPARTSLQEFSPTPEPSPCAATHCGIWNKSSPTVDSESSMTISLSDSICEIFGSKEVSDILNIKCSRQYILHEEHLPAVATMLNVDVDRLRNVLEITQRLSHEQILEFPTKRDPSSSSKDPVAI